MKKIFIIAFVVLVAFAAVDMMAPQEAQALAPLECTTAADYNWGNPGWNTLCLWAIQMEQSTEWMWTNNLTPQLNEENFQLKEKIDALPAEIYAVNTKKTVTWYPLRA